MKKKDLAPAAGGRRQKNPRRLTLTRETIERLSDPLLGGVMGGLARHTFTNVNANANEDGQGADSHCG